MFHLMINSCKYSDTSITEGSGDAEHITDTAAVTTYHDDDEFVSDSLSETEHSPFNNEHRFYSSKFFQSATNSKGKSLLFTAIPNSGLKDDNIKLYESIQSCDSQNVFRNTSRNKIPLKAVDLELNDVNHLLQANDRSVVRNMTAGRVISGYASREKVFQLDVPPDHHNNWIS